MHCLVKEVDSDQFDSLSIPDSIKEIICKDFANKRTTSWNYNSEYMYIQNNVICKLLCSQNVLQLIVRRLLSKAEANTHMMLCMQLDTTAKIDVQIICISIDKN